MSNVWKLLMLLAFAWSGLWAEDLDHLVRRLERLGWTAELIDRGIQSFPEYFLTFSSSTDEDLKPVTVYRGLWRPLRIRNYNPQHSGSAVVGQGYTFVAELAEASKYSRRIVLEFQIPSFFIGRGADPAIGFGVSITHWPDNRALLARVGFARFSLLTVCAKFLLEDPEPFITPPKSIRWVSPDSVIAYP